MTLTIDLSPEVRAKIDGNAKRQGASPTDLTRRLAEDAPLLEIAPQETAAEGRLLCRRAFSEKDRAAMSQRASSLHQFPVGGKYRNTRISGLGGRNAD